MLHCMHVLCVRSVRNSPAGSEGHEEWHLMVGGAVAAVTCQRASHPEQRGHPILGGLLLLRTQWEQAPGSRRRAPLRAQGGPQEMTRVIAGTLSQSLETLQTRIEENRKESSKDYQDLKQKNEALQNKVLELSDRLMTMENQAGGAASACLRMDVLQLKLKY